MPIRDRHAPGTPSSVGAVFVEPFDIPVGRTSVCADPRGAMFDLFEMTTAES